MRSLLALLLLVSACAPTALAGISETPLPDVAGSPHALAVAADGAVWITSDEAWGVLRYVAPMHRFDLARLSDRADATDALDAVVIDAAGDAWAASEAHVDRVRPTMVSLSLDAAPRSHPMGAIAAAGAGAVWRALSGADALLRIDTQAAVATRMALEPAGLHPVGLAWTGTDLVAANATHVVRIDPATGRWTDLHVQGLRGMTSLTFGGDRLWAAGDAGLASIDPATGTTDVWSLRGPVLGVAVAPDGAVWGLLADGVVRVDTTERTLHVYHVGDVEPHGPAAAPDGSVWWAEAKADRVGRAVWAQEEPAFRAAATVEARAGSTADLGAAEDVHLTLVAGVSGLMLRFQGGKTELTVPASVPLGHHRVLLASTNATGDVFGRYIDLDVRAAKGAPAVEAIVLAAAVVGSVVVLRRLRP